MLAQKAYELAEILHAPYFSHPRAVGSMAAMVKMPEIYVAVAYLHDTAEDCGLTPRQVIEKLDLAEEGIIESMVSLLDLLTKKDGQKYVDYIAAISDNAGAAFIKMIDITHNLHDSPDMLSKAKKDKYELARYILSNTVATEPSSLDALYDDYLRTIKEPK